MERQPSRVREPAAYQILRGLTPEHSEDEGMDKRNRSDRNEEEGEFFEGTSPTHSTVFYCKKLGFDNCIGNCSNNIWLMYDNSLAVNVLSDDYQALHCEFKYSLLPLPFLVTCVYARCSWLERLPLWDLLRSISNTSLPWIAGGDYNIISPSTEREGGAIHEHVAIHDFNSAIQDCHMLDPGYIGHPFTWYGPDIS